MKPAMRIFLALLAGLLLVLVGTGCTAKAKKAYHLSRADRYYNASQFGAAEIEYMNVLRLDSTNPQANVRLGLLYYEEGRLQRAALFLARASQLTPDNLEVRRRLGFIYSSVAQFTNALAEANYILQKNPQDDEAPILLAEASVLPKSIAATRQRLQTMARNGDRASIEVALGNLALRESDVATAEVDFKKAQALDPKSAAVSAGLAGAAWGQGDLKQADAFFQAAADASPVRSPRRMQYVRFKIQTGDLAGARVLLADIIKAAPDYVPAPGALAEIAAAEKKYDECATLLDNVLRLDPDNYDALLFQGQLDLAEGQPEQAVTHMERMVRIYPQIAGVYYQLASAYVAAGDLAKATASLNQALEINPNFIEATLLLADIQINSGSADTAIIALERLRQKQPKLVQAQLLLAGAYRQRNRPADALAIYQALENTYPTNAQVPMLRGATLFQMKDNAGARRAFERVLELSPDNLGAIEQLVNLDIAEKQFDAATRFVNSEIQKAPKQITLRLFAASIQLAQGRRDQAETILSQALDLDPANVDASLLLAQVYSETGRNDKALAKLDAVLAKEPENTTAYVRQAEIYSALKDNQKAADDYEQVLKINPRDSMALNNLAYLYSEPLNNLDRAYELAQRARQLKPSDPATADTLGWICFKRGYYATALDLEKESAAKLADPEVQFHFGMASYMIADEAGARAALQRAWQSGVDFPGRAECGLCLSILAVNPATADATARDMLKKRVADKPADSVALTRLARIYQREGNSDKAIATYEAILQAAPQNLDAMVALSQLYAADPGKLDRAYTLAAKAHDTLPDDAGIAKILGIILVQRADYNRAVTLLKQSAIKLNSDSEVFYYLGAAQFHLKNRAESKANLQQALALNLSAQLAGSAQQMLRALK